MTNVGEQIRRRREDKGWTGLQLAVKAGMAPSAVSQIETGKRNPNSASLVKLASALGVDVGDLYPKAQAPLPLEEETLMARPRVLGWLRDLGARLALTSEEEFSELVLGMDLEVDEDGYPKGIERLVGALWEEEDKVIGALMREFTARDSSASRTTAAVCT